MAEGLDPEALAALLGRYFDEARRQIELRGGTVEKFIGDAVVGVFGVPAAHEDDALRAVLAGLDIQQSIAADERQRSRPGSARGSRRGSASTPARWRSAANPSLSGHAVNMAARLEQAAGVGEVLIGADTARAGRRRGGSRVGGAADRQGFDAANRCLASDRHHAHSGPRLAGRRPVRRSRTRARPHRVCVQRRRRRQCLRGRDRGRGSGNGQISSRGRGSRTTLLIGRACWSVVACPTGRA